MPIIQESKIERELEQLPTQSHLTLFAILQLADEDALPARSNDIYEVYADAAETTDSDVKTDRTIRDRLSQLTLKGLLQVEEKNKGLSGGSFYQYRIGDVREELMRDVLSRDPPCRRTSMNNAVRAEERPLTGFITKHCCLAIRGQNCTFRCGLAPSDHSSHIIQVQKNV